MKAVAQIYDMVLKSHESGWVLRPGNPVSDKGDSQVLGVDVLLHIYVFSGKSIVLISLLVMNYH